MQDIDFSRYYRRNRRPQGVPESRHAKHGVPVSRVSLYLAIAFSSLALGFIAGTQLQKQRMLRELENRVVPESVKDSTIATANIATENESKDSVQITRPAEAASPGSKETSYLILARIYPDEKEASLAGLTLKRSGMNAFMARNGRKVKLYVGPMDNKKDAYETLARLKKNPEFSGAILYRK